MKALIVGGAGFIGSKIVEKLINNGEEVVVVDNLSTGKKEILPKEAIFYEMDITSPQLKNIFEKENIEYVCHLAASTNVRSSVLNPLRDAHTNVMGMISLLEQCNAFKVKRFVFSSTGGALYGNTDILPTPEDHEKKPISPYGINKLTGENYLYYYNKIHNLPATILRYSNVYGPGQDRKGEGGVVAVFIQNILMEKESIINGDGKQTRDFVYVDDVANANIMALKQEDKNLNVYNISSSKETDINTLYSLILKKLAKSVRAEHGPQKPGEIIRSFLDNTKARNELNWEALNNLEQGIEKTINYFLEKR